MPKVKVDRVQIEVPQGATVLQASEFADGAALGFLVDAADHREAGRDAGGGGVTGVSMNRAGNRLLATALMLIVAEPTLAQLTGTRLDQNRGAVGSISKLDMTTSVRAANTYAQCLARREGKRMRNALDLPFTSAEQAQALKRTQDTFDGCLGVSREFDTLVLSEVLQIGGAAEWFFRTELKNVDLTPLAQMTDEVLEKTDFRPRTLLEDLGLCIVRRSPERARSLLEARVASSEEAAVLKNIVPDVAPCVTQGTELKLNTPNLRAVIAYALYRASSKLGAGNA